MAKATQAAYLSGTEMHPRQLYRPTPAERQWPGLPVWGSNPPSQLPPARAEPHLQPLSRDLPFDGPLQRMRGHAASAATAPRKALPEAVLQGTRAARLCERREREGRSTADERRRVSGGLCGAPTPVRAATGRPAADRIPFAFRGDDVCDRCARLDGTPPGASLPGFARHGSEASAARRRRAARVPRLRPAARRRVTAVPWLWLHHRCGCRDGGARGGAGK
eukprot:349725-Chlamydomonas_euryale.AAC.4